MPDFSPAQELRGLSDTSSGLSFSGAYVVSFDSANQQLAHGDTHYAAGGNPYATRREIIVVLMECSVFPLSAATFR